MLYYVNSYDDTSTDDRTSPNDRFALPVRAVVVASLGNCHATAREEAVVDEKRAQPNEEITLDAHTVPDNGAILDGDALVIPRTVHDLCNGPDLRPCAHIIIFTKRLGMIKN